MTWRLTFFDSWAASLAVIGLSCALRTDGTTGAAPTTPDWTTTSAGTAKAAANTEILTLLVRGLDTPGSLIPRMIASESYSKRKSCVRTCPRLRCC